MGCEYDIPGKKTQGQILVKEQIGNTAERCCQSRFVYVQLKKKNTINSQIVGEEGSESRSFKSVAKLDQQKWGVSTHYSSLIKELRQLKKTESVLKSMIDKINHELNQLVVEELQIKSRDVQLSVEIASAKTTNPVPPMDEATCSTKEINQQTLNLEVQDERIFKSLEESDEEL
ncbi:uncharacterized protein LOC128310251 [Anopheles moucheti]|uniref:uncharacterized protein LOC128310251 n=1 Tax=Anopheles moucheti TaxID=186751 RepID=UPI0022F093BE|nr:uncharacterized protein LOC128310251 [Anopheles moucheti]